MGFIVIFMAGVKYVMAVCISIRVCVTHGIRDDGFRVTQPSNVFPLRPGVSLSSDPDDITCQPIIIWENAGRCCNFNAQGKVGLSRIF